jgi:hypothetical protein
MTRLLEWSFKGHPANPPRVVSDPYILGATDARAVASEPGVEHVLRADSRVQGQLRGSDRGRKVLVDPDERRVVIVLRGSAPDRSQEPRDLDAGVVRQVEVQSRPRAFNRF